MVRPKIIVVEVIEGGVVKDCKVFAAQGLSLIMAEQYFAYAIEQNSKDPVSAETREQARAKGIYSIDDTDILYVKTELD